MSLFSYIIIFFIIINYSISFAACTKGQIKQVVLKASKLIEKHSSLRVIGGKTGLGGMDSAKFKRDFFKISFCGKGSLTLIDLKGNILLQKNRASIGQKINKDAFWIKDVLNSAKNPDGGYVSYKSKELLDKCIYSTQNKIAGTNVIFMGSASFKCKI